MPSRTAPSGRLLVRRDGDHSSCVTVLTTSADVEVTNNQSLFLDFGVLCFEVAQEFRLVF